ncbi:uncharacterized protein ELE39_001007 [Cryptosporidium sp. chipmunk genotype I]|uniref:uncharacterized protein n=1 Tax=Cryptosporidium sp. chipmunk genotype I TaxID=1280935 RepID=UPI00351A769B|nr:hypothetical protein ELE39_001007 [Cryptosporidium sp. chipmunk genotype I]
MNIFSFVGINFLVFVCVSINITQFFFEEFSFLSLKESSNEISFRKNVMITVNECSVESINLLLGIDQVLKLEVSAYHCYLKDLERAVESCKMRCTLSRRIGRCRGIEDRLATTKGKYKKLLEEQAKWTKLLTYCIKCRALTEYMLIKSKGGVAKKTRITSHNSESDPAYTLQNLFDSFVSRDLSTYEILYLSRMDRYKDVVGKLCKEKSRTLCKCAQKSLKNLKDNKSILQSTVVKQDAYQRRWYSFYSKDSNNIPESGNTIDSIKEECKMVLEKDAEIQNGISGVLNQGFTEEELAPVTSL